MPAPPRAHEDPDPEESGFEEGGEPTLLSHGLEGLERRAIEAAGGSGEPEESGIGAGAGSAEEPDVVRPSPVPTEDVVPVADGEASSVERSADEAGQVGLATPPRSATLVFDGAALEETLRRLAAQDEAVEEAALPRSAHGESEAAGTSEGAGGSARLSGPTGVFDAVAAASPSDSEEQVPAEPSLASQPAAVPVAPEPWEELGGEQPAAGPSRSGTLIFSPSAIVELTDDLLEIDEDLEGEGSRDEAAATEEPPLPSGEVEQAPAAGPAELDMRTSVSAAEPEPEPEPPWRLPVETQASPREALTAVDMPALIDPSRFWPSASVGTKGEGGAARYGTMAFDPEALQDATTSPGAAVDEVVPGPSTSPDLETVSPEEGEPPAAPNRHATLAFDPSLAATSLLENVKSEQVQEEKTVRFDAKEFASLLAGATEVSGTGEAGGGAAEGGSAKPPKAEPFPPSLDGASFGATIPSFAGVEIDDLDPSRGPDEAPRPFELERDGEVEGGPTTLEPVRSEAGKGPESVPAADKRSTMHSLDAAWARPGVREAETQVIPTVAGSDPAWTGEPSALRGAKAKAPVAQLDERATRGPVGPATARPQKQLVPRTTATTLPVPADEEPEDEPVAASGPAAATSFLRAMVVLGLFVILTAFAVPSVDGDGLSVPWKTVSDPQSLSFLCAVFFGLNLLLAIVPMPLLWRSLALGLGGVAALEFGRILFVDAGLRFVFRAQPAIAAVFAAGILPAVLGTLAAITLPAGLYARGRFPASLAARVTVALGLALGVFALLGWQMLPGGSGRMPVLDLIDAAFGGASLQGDRLGSMALLVSALMLPLSLLAFLGKRRTGFVTLWAFVYSAGLIVALVIEAVYVGHLEQWREVLEPTKLSLFMAAGLLLAPPAVGYFIGAVGARPEDIRA